MRSSTSRRSSIASPGSVGLTRFALYVFDHGRRPASGSPLGLRERISAIISPNGNAYEEGLRA
jgi:hypothetical protein